MGCFWKGGFKKKEMLLDKKEFIYIKGDFILKHMIFPKRKRKLVL